MNEITEIVLVLLCVAAVVAFVWARVRIDLLENSLEMEKKWRREDQNEMKDRHWRLCEEVDSGFEALGLKKKPFQPSAGPRWVKK
jgi:hypothetical protein